MPAGRAEERQQAFFVVPEDVEREAHRVADAGDDAGGVPARRKGSVPSRTGSAAPSDRARPTYVLSVSTTASATSAGTISNAYTAAPRPSRTDSSARVSTDSPTRATRRCVEFAPTSIAATVGGAGADVAAKAGAATRAAADAAAALRSAAGPGTGPG